MLVALLVYACANRGYPEGGPKDTTPPEVVAEVPASFTKNFNKKKVDIYFNEFVQLKEINEKFIFSPPLKKNPRVSLRGKYIQVSIGDTLKPNTTYTMDFADAIVDNNEGNPLGFYRYVFSTGNEIDSLEISGQVVNAESYEPMLNVLVALYENHADSVPLLHLPDYIARTDSSGNFRFTNLKDAVYRVAAIEDNNKDKKYTPESEMLEDVIIENKQAIDMSKIYGNILSSNLNVFETIISNNLNMVMKFLTVVSVIIAVPTVVSSFWGMNVPVPFQENPYGFLIVFIISLIITIMAGLYINRKENHRKRK